MFRASQLAPIICCISLFLGGCAGLPYSFESDSDTLASFDQNPNITLTLAHSWTATSTTAVDMVHRSLVERFIQDNPSITLNEDILDNASLKVKIKTLAAANALPDVFMMLGSDAKMLLDNRLIMPVDQLLEQDPEWNKGFRPDSFDDFRFGGITAGIPMQMTLTSVIYYNADIFKRAGYSSFPSTWEDFMDAIPRIRALGIIPISMGNKDQWVAGSCLLSALGDRFTGTPWFDSIANRTGASFTDASFVRALEAVKQLSKAGAFNEDMNRLDNFQQREAYYKGKAAMFMEGGWAVSSVITDAPPSILEQTHLAVLPQVPGGLGEAMSSSGGSGWAFALNANLKGEKLQAAVKLVKELTGDTAANEMAAKGDISGSYATIRDQTEPSLFSEYLVLLDGVQLTPVYDVRLPPEVVQELNNELQQLIRPGSTLSPYEAASKIEAAYRYDRYSPEGE
ncbi:extracellular solute-binding protein [Paenibacillus sp. MMO-177]|uniref:extracellular solute-binding protein n=1 Tax=Paenibacillus sp. MMO-177 TaxID=3081289 RepID=UPI003015E537